MRDDLIMDCDGKQNRNLFTWRWQQYVPFAEHASRDLAIPGNLQKTELLRVTTRNV